MQLLDGILGKDKDFDPTDDANLLETRLMLD